MVLYGYDASVFNAAQGSDHWLEWFDIDVVSFWPSRPVYIFNPPFPPWTCEQPTLITRRSRFALALLALSEGLTMPR